MIEKLRILSIVVIYFVAAVYGKPALDVENRNLCEDEPDLAECIREVEKVKSTPMALHTEEESSNQKESKSSNEGDEDSLANQYELIRKVREASEKERKFWSDELSHMNQWHKYGL